MREDLSSLGAERPDDVAPAPAPPEPAAPLLHREVRQGALLWIVGVVQFFVAMVVVQLAWTTPYSLTQNYLSDLGNTACGPYGGRYVCSPLYYVFNDSIIVLGVLLLIGAVWIRSALPPKFTSKAGLFVLCLAGAGAAGVGFLPENVDITVHSASALLAFAGGAIGVLLLAAALGRHSRWAGFWAYSVPLAVVSLGAWGLVILADLHVGGIDSTLGPGGIERLIGFPVLLWALVFGLQLARAPVFAPSGVHPGKPHARAG
ncbi:MAG: DUF998 domain-containing protein [Thermoplasmata archaeon]